jgi:ABC-type transporter Mla subunit MlaD
VLAAGALVALGIAGAGVYYETRIRAQADLQMARIDRLLAARDVTLRAEIERRLAAQTEAAGGVPDELRGRVARLGRTLDQLSLDVSSLEMRLPALDQEVERISYGTGRMADDLARAGVEIDGLKTATPELTAWLARQKKELEQSMQGGRDALGGITGRVQSLAGEVDQSRRLLVDLNQSLVAGLERARADGEALRAAVDEMRATGQQVARLMQGAEARVQAAQGTMQAKIDRMLSGLAEQADLAVLRGGDVVRRAEGEIARRIATASEAALKAVADERAVKLAALAEQVSKTQSELEQTRTGMLASWQRLDASVGARQSVVLTRLAAFAGTIGVRVVELLQALDLMVARWGG